jgi:hypothetical protein
MTDEVKKDKSVRKYTFKGKNLEDLLALSKGSDKSEIISKGLTELLRSRIRRKIRRGAQLNKYASLVKKVVTKRNATKPGEKPVPTKTHFRNMIIGNK